MRPKIRPKQVSTLNKHNGKKRLFHDQAYSRFRCERFTHSYDEEFHCHGFGPFNTQHLNCSNAHSENDVSGIHIYIYIYPSCVYYMSRFAAYDQLRQLPLLSRRHKVKANL